MSARRHEQRDSLDLARLREQIRAGALRGPSLCAQVEARSEAERDRWVEALLGIEAAQLARAAIDDRELIGYQPSGVGAVLALIRDVPITAADRFVDIGSGLGKVTMLVHLLTGANASGLERDAGLVTRARERAAAFGLDGVSYVHGDARDMMLEASVYFMYAPVTGQALARVMERLEASTRGRSVKVCTLGLDLARFGWLRERPSEDLFVSIYDRAA